MSNMKNDEMTRWDGGQGEDRQEAASPKDTTKSICGCIMCEFHVSARELQCPCDTDIGRCQLQRGHDGRHVAPKSGGVPSEATNSEPSPTCPNCGWYAITTCGRCGWWVEAPKESANSISSCADTDPIKDCPCGGRVGTSSCAFPESVPSEATPSKENPPKMRCRVCSHECENGEVNEYWEPAPEVQGTPPEFRCSVCGEFMQFGASDKTVIHFEPCKHSGLAPVGAPQKETPKP